MPSGGKTVTDLEKARQRIDETDRKLLDLLAERMQIAEDVAAYKTAHGLPVLDEVREQRVLQDRTAAAQQRGLPDGIHDVFRAIMRMSRQYQRDLLVRESQPGRRAAFQGVPGANSHLALVEFLGDNIDAMACETFEEVFRAVERGEAAYGVMPIENSFAGSVVQVYDLLAAFEVFIIAEKQLRIDHMLVGLPGTELEDIHTVYSHEQALAQCSEFFRAHPQIVQHPYYNTAGAAKFVSEQQDQSCAALANSCAAQLYDLEILEETVNTSRENTTRFILIASQPYRGTDANKATVTFRLAHQPGALAEALTHFASHGLNMVKIESRPLRDRNFEYNFYVDFEGREVRPKLERAIQEDSLLFSDIRILGVFKK